MSIFTLFFLAVIKEESGFRVINMFKKMNMCYFF